MSRQAWEDVQPKRSSSLPTNSRAAVVHGARSRAPLSRSLAVDKGLDMTRAHSASSIDTSSCVDIDVPKNTQGVVLSRHITSQIDISSQSSTENIEHSQAVIMNTEQGKSKEPYLRLRVQPAVRSPLIPRYRSKSPVGSSTIILQKHVINGRQLSASQTAICSALGNDTSYCGLLTANHLGFHGIVDSRSPTNSREGSESSDKENRAAVASTGDIRLARASSLKPAGVKKSVNNTVHFQ